jgi:hypothetical protein
MKLLPVLVCVSIVMGLAGEASAKHKKKRKVHATPPPAEEPINNEPDKAAAEKPPLDFDFFGGQPAAVGAGKDPMARAGTDLADADVAAKVNTRRWMLTTHQTLGIATWVLMVGTVTVGQLNYNQLYGGGGGSNKWQTPHQILVLSTSVAFAAAAAFAIFAPTPYPKPLKLDTGLVHRIAVIGATLGMVTEGVLGWVTSHQANAGNSQHLATLARTHQIVGYSTLGFLTIAGAVWFF